jgi:hypothetical protein
MKPWHVAYFYEAEALFGPVSRKKKDLATLQNPPDEPFNDLTRPPGELVHLRVIEGSSKVKPSEFTVYKSMPTVTKSTYFQQQQPKMRLLLPLLLAALIGLTFAQPRNTGEDNYYLEELEDAERQSASVITGTTTTTTTTRRPRRGAVIRPPGLPRRPPGPGR